MKLTPGHRHALLPVLSAAVVAVLALTGCTSQPPGPQAPPPSAAAGADAATEPADRPELRSFYQQKPAWSACGDLQCANLTVPMDYRHPENGRTFTLPLIRTIAADAEHRIGSLVFNPGGPGASGVAQLKDGGATSFSERLRARFDIVGFDPRGVAGSKPALNCGTPEETADQPSSNAVVPATDAERKALVDQADRAAAACAAHSGEILPHVGTSDVARDLDVLRAALGDGRLSYLGWSYGTYLGTVYGELFPQRVRALVLDGAVDPAQDWEERARRSGAAFRKAVDDYADQCASVVGKDCPARTPEAIRKLVVDLYAKTARKPLRIDGTSQRLDQNALHNAITASMYAPEAQWQPLSQALAEASRGNGTKLAALGHGSQTGGTGDTPGGGGAEAPRDNSDDALTAVNCLDVPHPADPQAYWNALDRASKESGAYGASVVLADLNCRTWPKGPTTPHPVHAENLPPVLVVGTTGDPATPYEDARSLAAQLPGGMLLTYRGLGHGAYGRSDACVTDAVDGYLTALHPVPAGTTC